MRILEGKTAHGVALFLLLALPFIFLWEMTVEGEQPIAGDTQAAQALGAWAQQTREELGRTPLWCPGVFSGMPSRGSFIHNPSSVFDLTRWLRRPFPDLRGMRYYVMLLLGALALYRLLVRRGALPWSALTGALAFVMTPYALGLVAAGHSTKLQALYMAPVVFLALDAFLEKRSALSAAGLSGALALQFWNNHPQISYYTLLLGGIYAALVLLLERPPAWRGRGWLVGLLLGGVALALAAGLVLDPYAGVLEYTPYSIRGGPGELASAGAAASGSGWAYATAWSFPPRELVTFLFPAWFGLAGETYWGSLPFTQSTHYLGISVLFLVAMGLLLGRGRRRWLLLGLALLTLLIGFGRHFAPLYRLLFHGLPKFDHFRVPSMIYAFLPLVLAGLCATGVDAIATGRGWVRPAAPGAPAPRGQGRRRTRPSAGRPTPAEASPRAMQAWPWVTGLAALLLLVWLLAGSAISAAMQAAGAFVRAGEAGRLAAHQLAGLQSLRGELLRDSVALGLVLLTACAALVEARRRRWLGPTATGLLFFALVVVDLWVIDRQFYDPRPPRETEAGLRRDEVIRFLQDQEPPFRVAPLTATEFGSNRYAAFGLESIGGYQPAKLRIYDDLLRSDALYATQVLAMLNVEYILADRSLEAHGFPLIRRARGLGGAEVWIHAHPRPCPRAWFVDEVRTLETPRAVLEQLGDEAWDPLHTAWLVADESGALPARLSAGHVPPRDPTRQAGLEVAGERLGLPVEVVGPEPGLLVVSEIAYPPGWEATLDGEPVALLRVNHVLRAVLVPPGIHQVELRAVAPSLAAGVWVSRLSALLLALVALGGGVARWRDRRRGRSASAP